MKKEDKQNQEKKNTKDPAGDCPLCNVSEETIKILKEQKKVKNKNNTIK